MPLPLLVGAVVFTVTLVLRYAGILVGPAAVAVALLGAILAPGPRRVAERFLLLFALVFGWLPLLGWVPSLGTTVDVPGIVLAVGIGVVCGRRVRSRGAGAGAVALPTPTEIVALVVGVLVTLWWALPFARLNLSGRLQWLFAGWDNNTHFSIFQANLSLGSFIQVHSRLPNGLARLGYDYPQGMHQAWAQLVRLWSPRIPMTIPSVLTAYSVVLVFTAGSVVILVCMAICRLCQRDLLAALPAMAVVVALFGVGRFGPFNGFPNYELAIAAGAVAISLMVRPTLSATYNCFAVAGLGLIVVYNWFPLFLLIIPAVVVAAMRARSASRGRIRIVVSTAIAATAIAYVMPATSFLHRGVTALNEAGGGIQPPWGLVMVSIGTLIAVAAIRQATHPDRWTNLIVGAPAVLGGIAVTVLAAFEARSSGVVSYYGQKFAAGVFAVCVTVLAVVVASHVSTSAVRRRLSTTTSIIIAVVIAVSALQVDGFVGPVSGVLHSHNDAAGIYLHGLLVAPLRHSVAAEELLLAAQVARDGSGIGQWWFVNPQPRADNVRRTNFADYAEWFLVLRGQPSVREYNRIGALAPYLNGTLRKSVTAQYIIESFSRAAASSTRIFVPEWLRREIVRQDPIWGRSGVLVALPVV